MVVEQIGAVYRCNVCGNEVRVITVGGGTLVCCKKDMENIEEESDLALDMLPDVGG